MEARASFSGLSVSAQQLCLHERLFYITPITVWRTLYHFISLSNHVWCPIQMFRHGVFSKCFWVVAGCLNREMGVGMERRTHLLLSEHHLLWVEDCHPEYHWIPLRQADWPPCAPEIWPWVDIKRSHPLMSMVQYQLWFLCYSQVFFNAK